jgi:hypothetical protein
MAQDAGNTPTADASQGAATAATAVDEMRVKVQNAFKLGWHVAELFHFDMVGTEASSQADGAGAAAGAAPPHKPARRPTKGGAGAVAPLDPPATTPDAPLPTNAVDKAATALLEDCLRGIGSLGADKRKAILIRQVREDVHNTWIPTLDAPSAGDLDKSIHEAGAENEPDAFKSLVRQIHETLLSGLTVADYRLGKGYGLGRALAEIAIVPGSIESDDKLTSGMARPDVGKVFEKALQSLLDGERIMKLQSWLLDMRDWFSPYAADAVSTTLGGWALWAVRPTLADRGPDREVDWGNEAARGRVERALQRQGDVWRGLLSGEKVGTNMAGADYYFKAMASVLRRIARLALGFLGTSLGLLLFLIVIVAAMALYFAAHSNSQTGVLAAVIALLGSLGITTGTAGASVKQAWSEVEGPLWNWEISSAVANAAWHNPAPLGSIEAIQLLLAIGDKPDAETETRARHPNLTMLRNIPVGRIGIVLMVASITIGLFAANAGALQTDAAFFLPPLCIVAFLALIDSWDLLISFAARQAAPFLALPERIALPTWVLPLGEYLAPILLVSGILAGHFFWH